MFWLKIAFFTVGYYNFHRESLFLRGFFFSHGFWPNREQEKIENVKYEIINLEMIKSGWNTARG